MKTICLAIYVKIQNLQFCSRGKIYCTTHKAFLHPIEMTVTLQHIYNDREMKHSESQAVGYIDM